MSLYAKDTIIVDAYITCSDIPDVPRLSYKAFRLSCARCLILAAGTLKAVTKSSSNSSGASREKYVQKDTVSPN
jgi:hypothetical protein